jgi:hypothetical protein
MIRSVPAGHLAQPNQARGKVGRCGDASEQQYGEHGQLIRVDLTALDPNNAVRDRIRHRSRLSFY